jgi:membrane-associated phospholipid phosphatase
MLTPRRIVGRAALVVALAASLASYELVNHPAGQLHVLRTPLDAALPFVPLFAIPYLLYLPYLALTLLLFGATNWRRFAVLALAFIIASLSADVVYLLFQTYVQRPMVVGDGLGPQLVRFVYAHDQPYNDFPSLHTAGATLCAIAYARWRPAYGLAALPLTLAIIAATVLIRQHYLADVAGGLALAALAWLAASWLSRRFAPARAGSVSPARSIR